MGSHLSAHQCLQGSTTSHAADSAFPTFGGGEKKVHRI